MIIRKQLDMVLTRLDQFPAVVLLGPRQVGKTTLAQSIASPGSSVYLDLENPRDRSRLTDANRYLDEYMDVLVILDEVHRVPELFQTLRGSIDLGRSIDYDTGRFLLLGSASMDLLQQTGESLAGRVAYVELAPFAVTEVGAENQERLWVRGGFPDSYLAKSDQQSLVWRDNFISTYLERDIPELGPRIPAETLRRFWTMLAHNQGGMFNAAQLAQSLAVSGKTVSRYLDLMVDLLLVRRLRPFHANVGKRLVKSPKTYVRDSGIVHALLNLPNRDALFGHPIAGASWEGFVIDSLLSSAGQRVLPSFYRTSAGAEIDLILEFPGLSEKWAVEIKSGTAPSPTKGLYNAIEDVAPDKCFIVHAGSERYPLAEHIEAIGLSELCELLAARGDGA